MARYRRLPTEVEAEQYNSADTSKLDAFTTAFPDADEEPTPTKYIRYLAEGPQVYEMSTDTWVDLHEGDYVVKGWMGEFVCVTKGVFEASYGRVED